MREYLAYFAKRIGVSIFVLLGLSIVIFVISRIVPGDPARISLGANATEEAVQLRPQIHLKDEHRDPSEGQLHQLHHPKAQLELPAGAAQLKGQL